MGEMAEDMVDGSACSLCGCYFKHPIKNDAGESVGIYTHDYPVVCWDCWKGLTKEQRKIYQRAEVETF